MGFVGQPLFAVLCDLDRPKADSQEWLSYKNRKLTNLSVVDCGA
jgi:hypothetical protein